MSTSIETKREILTPEEQALVEEEQLARCMAMPEDAFIAEVARLKKLGHRFTVTDMVGFEMLASKFGVSILEVFVRAIQISPAFRRKISIDE